VFAGELGEHVGDFEPDNIHAEWAEVVFTGGDWAVDELDGVGCEL